MTPIESVRKCIGKRYHVTEMQLSWKSRGPKEWSWPRQVGMWICVKLNLAAHETIGTAFNRTKNDVIHSYNKVQNDVENYPFLRKEVDEVLNLVVTELKSVSV